jgi:spermidine synthase
MNGFMKDTLSNCYNGLKPDGILAVNIANVKTYPNIEEDMVEVAKAVGFVSNTIMRYALSSLSRNRSNKYKYEPIFIFTKTQKPDILDSLTKASSRMLF